jgi:tRNA nucleotidyltransferase (CCA-adding enzyme)
MDVITTHVNADFDCLGSMIAARKLYPDAQLVFPGSQEKGVRDFLSKADFSYSRLKDITLAAITRLILVDCQHASRIGSFATIIDRPDLEIHIYDHHPDTAEQIPATQGTIRACGSTSAILITLLKEKGVQLTRTEATAVLLGIYEDTGNLTYSGTSTDDFTAAAWLLEQGAELAAVSEFLTRAPNSEQVSLLNDLLHSMKRLVIGGFDVCIATANRDYYVSDIATLAQMLREMESLETLFMVVGMGSRVHIIGRSRSNGIDVGALLRGFGGGGHPTAASATVKELTAIQALHRLEDLLLSALHPGKEISSIMSSPVKTIAAVSTIADARGLLTRYNVNAMPVMEGKKMIGVISRRIVEKALYHHLDDSPVTDYMHTEFVRLQPDTPIIEAKKYLTGEGQRFAPVFSDDRLVGVVTRTELFRYLNTIETKIDQGHEREDSGHELINKIRHSLPHDILEALRKLGITGDDLGLKVFAVGGFVRDLLIGEPNADIDVTVEGDGILFAESFAARYGCRVKSHQKFGTATIIFPDGSKIDVASTRLEYYDSPGVLPTVERSSLKMDLYRRDFTINTLAMSLSASEFGRLIDFFSARQDLKEKSIRVLHNLSFVEDPTRIFRAVRFEQRLGFKMAVHTENLIKNSIRMNFLDKLGGRRLFNELVHILEEKDTHLAIERIASLGALKFIHRSLEDISGVIQIVKESSLIISWFELLYLKQPVEKWIVYFLALCNNLSPDDFVETCVRLDIGQKFTGRYFEARIAGAKALETINSSIHGRSRSLLPSEVCTLLRGLPLEMLLHLMAETDEGTRRQFSIYFTNLSQVTTVIDGNDLQRLGLQPGAAHKRILAAILAARLDGLIENGDDERTMAQELIHKETGGNV